MSIKSPRKLIEVALPLDAINAASAKEKALRYGHPSTLHLWWARRPLAAARAVIFAQMVNDPGFQRGGGFKYGVNKKDAEKERKRLFGILEDLVRWENTNNESVLEAARAEIARSWREVCDLNKDHPNGRTLFDPSHLPSLHDPFAGGGAIPLEAQRLGLVAFASDLNPVATLLNKAMIDIPAQFATTSPVNPASQRDRSLVRKGWQKARGLAEDVRHYGQWIRDEAQKRIGHLYPRFDITEELAAWRDDLRQLEGESLPVVAWLWARTVASPSPAFSHLHTPLVSTFVLGTKKGKEVYLELVVEDDDYRFEIRHGKPPTEAKGGTKLGRGSNFTCVFSNTAISGDYIKKEGQAGRLGSRLIAIALRGPRGRVYVSPTSECERLAKSAEPPWAPTQRLIGKCRDQLPLYGMDTFADVFTQRQLVALTTFADLIKEARQVIKTDAVQSGLAEDGRGLNAGGDQADAYAEAISVYLSFALDRTCDYSSAVCSWHNGPKMEAIRNTFGRQALPMVWDFAEANLFSDSSGNWLKNIDWIVRCFASFPAHTAGHATQEDAATQGTSVGKVVSTDPPYYDNIMYADLSDYFYVWLRPLLKDVFPDLFATVAVPKSEELVASSYRNDSKEEAEQFFLSGMSGAMQRIAEQAHPAFPVTIYYAFRQAETKNDGTASTGWETFLDAVIRSGFAVIGTWPMRTELGNRILGRGANALASSVVLVCRQRGRNAAEVSRREFIRELNQVLPEAFDEMTRGIGEDQSPVAPVDLSQAIIGPGMAVFSKYSAVLEADGEPMSVRTALQLINRFLAEDDFDKDTQFCLHWFEEYGWEEGAFGQADVLARAKATAVDALDEAGVIESGGGNVRLLRWSEYPSDWDPATDSRTPVWEALHHLIRGLKQGGESSAGELLAGVQSQAEAARQLAYRLYTLCERKGWAEDAGAYNELITSWSGIETASPRVEQKRLF